jgi:chorismate mutase
VSRLRHLAAVSNLDPDFAEKFLSFVIHEVVRQHETVPRGITEGSPKNELRSTRA